METLMREAAPQALGALIRRYGRFDACEDAVQEALLAAAQQWPAEGVPDNPRAWLITVASRRLTDQWRSEDARRKRETTVALQEDRHLPGPGEEQVSDRDDTLTLLFLCCHPSLSPSSQIALTLRAVGGLTTAEIAAAFLVPESTMGQRISRAKKSIKTSGTGFHMPPIEESRKSLAVVLHVLYLIFNEGYTATSGEDLQRLDLADEAMRLTRMVRRLRPEDGEVAGLLALMLLTDSRRAARTTPDGGLVPLAGQDRSRWNRARIDEGVALITDSLSRTTVGPYQLQAAISAVHAEAPTAAETDWPQILALYDLLDRVQPGPMVSLNRAVAVAMVEGPDAGLALLPALEKGLDGSHRLDAVRAHLLEMKGEREAAREAYLLAAERTASAPERRYLEEKAAGL
ncbi:RNA polymerase sigma factor [Actinorhabdospora filicis]|uniref:RNA polymerase sigma factor n=1 Tax=Actinorhabdospora filicis TaxID=1785913 RepID=UPI00255595DE|nr:sigma-70 family RNA polymerase sigma factor [Actinorhabdospora filicis]